MIQVRSKFHSARVFIVDSRPDETRAQCESLGGFRQLTFLPWIENTQVDTVKKRFRGHVIGLQVPGSAPSP